MTHTCPPNVSLALVLEGHSRGVAALLSGMEWGGAGRIDLARAIEQNYGITLVNPST